MSAFFAFILLLSIPDRLTEMHMRHGAQRWTLVDRPGGLMVPCALMATNVEAIDISPVISISCQHPVSTAQPLPVSLYRPIPTPASPGMHTSPGRIFACNKLSILRHPSIHPSRRNTPLLGHPNPNPTILVPCLVTCVHHSCTVAHTLQRGINPP